MDKETRVLTFFICKEREKVSKTSHFSIIKDMTRMKVPVLSDVKATCTGCRLPRQMQELPVDPPAPLDAKTGPQDEGEVDQPPQQKT